MNDTQHEERPDPLEPSLLSPSELARYLCVSLRTLWRMRDAGDLPAPINFGRLVRWSKKDVDKWLGEINPNTPEVIEEAAKRFRGHRRSRKTQNVNERASDYKANKGN